MSSWLDELRANMGATGTGTHSTAGNGHSGNIPRDDELDELLRRWTTRNEIEARGQTIGPDRKTKCLFGHEDWNPSLHIFDSGGWKCFQCGRAGGSVIDLIAHADDQNPKTKEGRQYAIDAIRARLGVERTQWEPPPTTVLNPDLAAFTTLHNETPEPPDPTTSTATEEGPTVDYDTPPPPPRNEPPPDDEYTSATPPGGEHDNGTTGGGQEQRNTTSGNGTAGDAKQHTSWWPVDLTDAIAGKDVPPPTMWERDDGLRLIYPARVHWFLGESESLKSWAAQAVAATELKAGHNVLYIDLEDDDRGVVSRLKTLGVDSDAIHEHLVYIRPDEPLTDRHGTKLGAYHELQTVVKARSYTLCVLDGVTEAMTIEGLALLDNTDIAAWMRLLPKHIATYGPAVICIDHVAKSTDGNNRYAIGGQHKLAGVTGAAYKFTVSKKLARPGGSEMVEGQVVITVTKDRPGYVRGHADTDDEIALFAVTAYPDGAVTTSIEPPGEARVDMRLVDRILVYLGTYDGSAISAIEKGVEGSAARVRDTLRWMAGKGLLRVEQRGRGHYHHLTDDGRAWGQ